MRETRGTKIRLFGSREPANERLGERRGRRNILTTAAIPMSMVMAHRLKSAKKPASDPQPWAQDMTNQGALVDPTPAGPAADLTSAADIPSAADVLGYSLPVQLECLAAAIRKGEHGLMRGMARCGRLEHDAHNGALICCQVELCWKKHEGPYLHGDMMYDNCSMLINPMQGLMYRIAAE